jgi:Fic family protein
VYKPPYTITSKILKLTSDIVEAMTEIKQFEKKLSTPKLRKKNRVKSITGSLQIEGNTFTEEKVTAMIEGKRVLGSIKEITEVEGAIKAYNHLDNYAFKNINDLLYAHQLMMNNLLTDAGSFRKGNVGVMGKDGVSHIAPPAKRVNELMQNLFEWLSTTNEHLLVASCIFHYEFEFIHPFSDGNGRIGRLWQTIILKAYKDLFGYLPIESIVKENQQKYYDVLEQSGTDGECTVFIEFMLDVILKTVKQFTDKSNHKSNLKSDQIILRLLKANNKITIKQLCEKTKLSESGVKKVIRKLKDNSSLERVGSLKGGHWEVTE